MTDFTKRKFWKQVLKDFENDKEGSFLFCNMSKTFEEAWLENHNAIRKLSRKWLREYASEKLRDTFTVPFDTALLFSVKQKSLNKLYRAGGSALLHLKVRRAFLKFVTKKDCPLLKKPEQKKTNHARPH